MIEKWVKTGHGILTCVKLRKFKMLEMQSIIYKFIELFMN